MADCNLSNDAILDQLKLGFANFELISTSSPLPSLPIPFFGINGHASSSFFARIGPSLTRASSASAAKKVEHYNVQKVTGDGRCMFRALVKGMAVNKGTPLNSREERNDADDLRMAVKEVICESAKDRSLHEEAVVSITVDDTLKGYCQRIGRADFWGGESELLVLSKLCRQPIIVYIPEHEHTGGGSGFIPIAEYGSEFGKPSRKGKGKKCVRLVYSGRNHYDLLV